MAGYGYKSGGRSASELRAPPSGGGAGAKVSGGVRVDVDGDEPSPEVRDLMEEIAAMVVKRMPGMQEVAFHTVLFPKGSSPVRMSVTLEPGV